MLTEIQHAPVEIFRRLRHLPHLAFLDSARFHPGHGRFSFLAADPLMTLRTDGARSFIHRRSGEVEITGDPWEILDALLTRFRHPGDPDHPRLPVGAAIGFLGYGMGQWLDRSPQPRPALIQSPDLWFAFYDVLLAFDHVGQRGWLVSSGMDESGVQSEAQAVFRRDQFLDELQSDVALFPFAGAGSANIVPMRSQADHELAIRKALDYIRRGDVYQVNLAYEFMGTVSESPHDLYLRLRSVNPSPFASYLDFGEGQILSSSPERFLHMDRRKIQTRPIKGTCARGDNPLLDWKQAEALLRSEKNQAELLMITDLLRNDLGRVAEFGSVHVSELSRCEQYETVYHLVSTIEAKLRPHILHLDALAACFPGGSITGAPKLRAMEIIHELETFGRGIYTGSLGYIGFNGVSDFNILIRSILHRHGQTCFHAGGGIVADSDPRQEFIETLDKAQGMLRLWKTTPIPSPQTHRTAKAVS